ncbi:hypothetical protein [Bacillus pumilus]|uniref:hypothetical protein n=1 Tax=Bacillus pumilus TaxID=1408 RepID=UPI0011565F27|nr:hypothetical protein [Bacillus pumilus]
MLTAMTFGCTDKEYMTCFLFVVIYTFFVAFRCLMAGLVRFLVKSYRKGVADRKGYRNGVVFFLGKINPMIAGF